MMMKQAGLKLRDWQRRWRAAVLGMCGGEIDRGRKMKGGERWVWWSGISWVLVGCVCTATCAHVLCVCVFVSPRLWEFLGFACFLKRDSTLLLLILNSYCSLSLCLTHTLTLCPLCLPLFLSAVSLPFNPLPPGLVERWANMSLFLCKSNWRQAFIGMTWRWVAKSFQPSC